MPVAVRRKRTPLRTGDLLEYDLPEGRCGYAFIADRGVLPGGGTPYVAAFASTYSSVPKHVELAASTVSLAAWTTDALLQRLRWKLVGRDFPMPPIPLPNFKVLQEGVFHITDFKGKFLRPATRSEVELLNYRFSVTADLFNDAVRASHGFGEWQPSYRKLTLDHAQVRALLKPA